MNSIWGTAMPSFSCLRGNRVAEVLVIGGGITGLLCAHSLRSNGVDAVLVEASTVCSGITKNTTAKITAQHGLCYHKLLQTFGLERAQQYLRANLAAVERFRELCREIRCDFTEADSYVYSLQRRLPLELEAKALELLGYEAEFCDTPALPFSTFGAIRFRNQAQFHPLKFLSAIAAELEIYENTTVLELLPHQAVTDRGTIRAEHIIVATHFPFLNKHGSYFLKLYQDRSYVLALQNAPNVGGMYVDAAQHGLSLRNYGSLLLLGGGGHRTGKQGSNWDMLTEFTQKYYPQAQIVARWATQDCMTLDGVPYIGKYGKHTDGLYVATGFGKWGMTNAMVAATLLTDLILGKDYPYSDIFDPLRTMLRPQLAKNAASAAINLLTPTVPRCPHLGCALKWNPQERSWDCPCHGSRFTEDGKLIDNPATGDKK